MDISTPVPLRDILSGLGIPAGEVHLIIVNDQLQESVDVLIESDDIVRVYPPIDGG